MSVSISIANPRQHRIAVSIFFFTAGITFAAWACRIPDIKNQLHLSDAGLGTVLFALPVGLMASLPLSGWLVSSFGSRKTMLTAALLYPATLVVLALAGSTLQLVTGLFFFGLWSNMLNISVNTQAVGVEDIYGRSIMASFHGVWSLAGFASAGFGAILISMGVSTVVHFSIVCGISALLSLFFYKYTLHIDAGKSGQPVFVLPDKALMVLGLIAFGSMVCEGTMFDWSGLYFQKTVEVPKRFSTIGFVAFMSTMAGGRFVSDWLTTRLGRKRMLQISGLLITTGLMTAVIFPYFIPATIGFLLVGMGVSSVVPLVYSAAGKSETMAPGAALAAVSTIGFIGFLLGPPTIGFIAEAANLRWSFTLIALLGFCTTLLATVVKIK